MAIGVAVVETEEIKWLSTLPSLSEDARIVRLLRTEEEMVTVATTMMHQCINTALIETP